MHPAPGLAVACLSLEGAAALQVKGLTGRIRKGRPFASSAALGDGLLRSEEVVVDALFCKEWWPTSREQWLDLSRRGGLLPSSEMVNDGS